MRVKHLDLAGKSLYLSHNMKSKIEDLIFNAVRSAHQKNDLPSAEMVAVDVDEPKADAHGDFSTNIAMVMAGAVIATLPMLIVYLMFQKYIIKGIAMTGLKG